MPNPDFYTRNEDQTRYANDVLDISDEISILLEQIENILFTRKTQVLGQKDFGVNLEDLLFTLNRNDGEIKSALLNQIYSYCPLALKYKVDVAILFQATSERDIAYIDIILNGKKAIGVII